MKRAIRFWFALAVLLACVIVVHGSWRFALMDPDEARYAQASREMIEQKSYIVPLYNDEPRLNKPILFYWLQIISFKLFGINEFAARFPSMVAGLGSILLVFFIARSLYDNKTAVMAIFVCIGNLFFFAFSKIGTLDVVLLFFFTLSLLLFLKAEACIDEGIKKKGDWYVILSALSLGLAFLTKGPVGVIVPFLIIILYLVCRWKLSPFTLKNIAQSILIFLVVVAPWGIALIWKVGMSQILSLVRKETAERYFIGFDHPQPFYFFILVFCAAFLPWSSFIPVALGRHVRIVLRERNGREMFLLIWLILPIVFFSFSGSKLPGYILPVLPAASIIIASGFAAGTGMQTAQRDHKAESAQEVLSGGIREKGWLSLSGISILAVILLVYAFTGYSFLDRYPDFRTFYVSTMLISLSYLILAIVFLVLRLRSSIFFATAVFSILFLFSLNLFAMPHFQRMRSMRELVAEKIAPGDYDRIVSYRYNLPSLLFYSNKKVGFAADESALTVIAEGKTKTLVVISEKNFDTLSENVKRHYNVDGRWSDFILLVPLQAEQP